MAEMSKDEEKPIHKKNTLEKTLTIEQETNQERKEETTLETPIIIEEMVVPPPKAPTTNFFRQNKNTKLQWRRK